MSHFLEFSRHFRRHGLPVPEIYAEDLSQGAYLEEDLGDTTLFEFLGEESQPARVIASAGALKRIARWWRCCLDFKWRRAAI
jgi:aminoglycoside/choline kinase family phosphotransferase